MPPVLGVQLEEGLSAEARFVPGLAFVVCSEAKIQKILRMILPKTRSTSMLTARDLADLLFCSVLQA